MRRLRQPVRTANSLLRQAIRQVSAVPVLTGSMLLALAPGADAITLGDVRVESALGQRLNATVPLRLEAGESLNGSCVSAGQQAADLRPVPGVRLSVPDASREGLYVLRLTSGEALDEPMYALELAVQCPGTPILMRQYVLMLDLPGAVATVTPGTGKPASAATPAATPTAARRLPAPARPVAPVEGGTTYRVAEGDTLFGIAARVQGRQMSLQAMADAIQAANPDAFIRNDPNLIKLGSRISIPGALADAPGAAPPAPAADTGPAPLAADPGVPAPSLPPVLDAVPPADTVAPMPASEAGPAAEVAQPAPEPAQPALAASPAPLAAPAAPRAEPAPAPGAAPAEATEPSPFVAAGAGIVFGLVVSTLLWFRGRLPARKQPGAAASSGKRAAAGAAAVAEAPVPLVTRPAEPGLTVSFTPAQEDALAAEFAAEPVAARSTVNAAPPEDITSELEEIFDSTDTTIQKRLDAEKTRAARSLVPDPEGYAPEMAPGEDVDFLVGDPTGEQAAAFGATVEQPRPNVDTTAEQPRPRLDPTVQSPTVDLRTLAASATGDQQQAQTLLEALTLLERDYEEELTASQVLDMSAVRDALGGDLDEPTQISEAQLREAARKKQR